MKAKLLLSLSLLLCLGLRAQTSFQKTYSAGNSGFSFSVFGQQIANGNFIIGGGVSDTINDNDYVHLIEINSSGNIVREKTLTMGAFNFSSDFMQQTTDGGFIMANWNNIVKIDSALNVQWSKSFNDTSWYTAGEYGTTVHQTFDGGYIIASDVREMNWPGDEDYFLLKLNANGGLVWQKNLGVLDSTNEIETSTRQTLDGGYIIAGRISAYSSNWQSDISVVKTDASGGVLWSKLIGGTSNERANDVIQLSSGEYIVTGMTQSFGVGQEDIFLLKLNTSGTLQWSKTYGGAGDDVGTRVVRANDGGYLLSCTSNSVGIAGDIVLIKTDSTGNILWTKRYGGNGVEGEYDVLSLAQTTDGGFFVSSFTSDTNFTSVCSYVIRTDSLGESGCNGNQANTSFITLTPSFQTASFTLTSTTAVSFNTISFVDTICLSQTGNCLSVGIAGPVSPVEIEIYPNPSTGKFILNLGATSGEISIYNLFGERIFLSPAEQLPDGMIDLSGQPEGVYLVNISAGNKTSTQKIVITR